MFKTLKKLTQSITKLNGTLEEIRDLMKEQIEMVKKPPGKEEAEKLLSKLAEILPQRK